MKSISYSVFLLLIAFAALVGYLKIDSHYNSNAESASDEAKDSQTSFTPEVQRIAVNTNSQAIPADLNTYIASKDKYARSDGQAVPAEIEQAESSQDRYLNKDGWQLPVSEKKDLETTRTYDSTLTTGAKIRVTSTSYVPSEDLFTKEPFEALGKRFGVIKISYITELRAHNKVYGYIVMAGRTKKDEESGKLVRVGPGFIYRYLDEDGDGKFEVLLMKGLTDTVPAWVVK